MNSTLHLTGDQAELGKQLLEQFLAISPDFIAALISTVDGRLMLERSRRQIGGSRIASMSASLIALGEALGSELNMRLCNHVIVSTDAGVVVLLRVDGAKHVLALTTVARSGVNLGTLLASSRGTAAKLGKLGAAVAGIESNSGERGR